MFSFRLWPEEAVNLVDDWNETAPAQPIVVVQLHEKDVGHMGLYNKFVTLTGEFGTQAGGGVVKFSHRSVGRGSPLQAGHASRHGAKAAKAVSI